MGSVIQVAENKGVRHTLAILDHCSLKVKVKSELNKTSQNIMATREEYAANHGEPQLLASGGGARLLTQPPAAVCCRVPPSLEDGYRTGVEESQYVFVEGCNLLNDLYFHFLKSFRLYFPKDYVANS